MAIMATSIHPNGPFGWWLILSGFVTGAILGIWFHKSEFLGGYASFRRRLLRLGHVAQAALGIINIVWASFVGSAGGTALSAASWGLLIGGVTMPLVCFLTAWREGFRHLFFIPVLSLGTAVLLTAIQGGG
jgi:hypothetical protein